MSYLESGGYEVKSLLQEYKLSIETDTFQQGALTAP